ncbi:ABC transporter permease [Chryseotalea sanaruensis]|uniref:ABC transporter permease n=1 Tax=Chryseotalea sanaruensis TaxID=2482724 RepID=A0A401U838_9BACT|nr:ABC transporter permease [Chryseotalea sanaruensis]GCC51046.1 ABC transporter permease [Chryseotalea sanaruensis]
MQLTNDHIDYIIKDLNYRGIVHDDLQHEFVDHICSAVEEKMQGNVRFLDAYHAVLQQFGHTTGLRQTQLQTISQQNTQIKIMLRSYFTIALRNLRKHSFYSFINVAGLSVGISICLVILLFVLNELRYDRHHERVDRIYRIHAEIDFAGNHYDMTYAPAPMAATLASDYPEVEAAVRFREQGSYLIKREADNIKESKVIWTDKDFFKIFTVPLIAGNPETALAEPKSIAISKEIADKFFPNEEAIGQTLILDNNMTMKVTAVYQDMPATSHFHFNVLIAMAGLDEAKSPVWFSNNFQTYFLLRDGANVKNLEEKFPDLITKHVMPQMKEVLDDFTPEKFAEAGNKLVYTTQALSDIHLYSSLQGEFEPNFDITYIYLFVAIALFILIIASINFMNLSTARSANRAKEVGVRKVMGSLRSHLMRQFLMESLLLSLFSFILAIGLAYLLLPLFNNLAARELSLPLTQPFFYLFILTGAIVVGFLAGVYPSFFLSAFKPVNVLKGNVALGMKSGFIRSSLVVFQFMISIFLVIATAVVYMQLDYIQTKKLGFNKDQVIMVDDIYALGNQRLTYKEEIMRHSFIENASIAGYLPVAGSNRSDTPWWIEGKEANQENMVSLQNWQVDHDYIKTFGMSIKEGRDFSHIFPSDSNAVILNESAAKALSFNESIIGKRVNTFGDDSNGDLNKGNLRVLTVIGVVEDFHFESLKQSVTPLMMFLSKRPSGYLSVRFQSANAEEVISMLEKEWKEMAPGQPFTYQFLDDSFGKMYAAESRLGSIFGIFSSVAIIIACLGLFALTAFTAEQCTKEIGIRKVLGASVSSIVIMLSKDYGKLVLIAFVLATPFAWWGVNEWLQSYEYKVNVAWWVYMLAGVVAFGIAWITMSYQSIRAALSNPVNSLRSE